MKNRVLKIGCAILFVTLIMFSFSFNTVNAAINQTYSESVGTSNTEDSAIEEKVKSTVILDALASFVYAVASIIENLVGNIFKSLTGSTDFPWADRIIFNSISLLDVNFFNASDGSFFKTSDGNDTIIAKTVRNTYFSILAIAIAFLTIVVAIAATRMAISTLANEKAKYKEAITKWLSSIILIFLMHNLMAFIFYVNEGLVEVASSILVKNMEGVGDELASKLTLTTDEDQKQAVTNFLDQNPHVVVDDARKSELINDEENVTIAAGLIGDETFKGVCLKNSTESAFWGNLWKATKGAFTGKLVALLSGNAPDQINGSYILSTAVDVIRYGDINDIKNEKDYWNSYTGTSEEKARKYESEFGLGNFTQWFTTYDQLNDTINYYKAFYNTCYDFKLSMYNSNGEFTGNNNDSDNKFDIIGNMAKYFKYKSWNFERDESGNLTGWKASKVSVTGALLYAIFLAQSILYFFSYVKRFFYIVILAILAPVIVLFDFLGKAVG